MTLTCNFTKVCQPVYIFTLTLQANTSKTNTYTITLAILQFCTIKKDWACHERNSIHRARQAHTGILLSSMGPILQHEIHKMLRDSSAWRNTDHLTKVPQHQLGDRYAVSAAVQITGASKMESSTDNVQQGSVSHW